MRKFTIKLATILHVLFFFPLEGNSTVARSESPYIIGELLGQTGNNFFQIATVQALAWDNGAEAFFPGLSIVPRRYQHYFSRFKAVAPDENVSCHWHEPDGSYHEIPYNPQMKVSGYLQSYKYFDRYKDRLTELFAPTPQDVKYIQKKYGRLLNTNNTVGIQIRYYFEDPYTYSQYGEDFLEKAMALFSKDSTFIVSSNRPDFAKQEVPTEGYHVIFLEKEPDYIDFYILTLCKNNIITNSTFGWWCAYLNKNPEKIIVCPQVWNRHGIPDIPNEWIQINAERIPPEQIR